jgi:hypothetical protein
MTLAGLGFGAKSPPSKEGGYRAGSVLRIFNTEITEVAEKKKPAR